MPSYWFACIPLSALIVVVWNTASQAQGLDGPETLEEVKVILDTIFLLVCSILVIFMNAGFGMLETGFCRQKNAVNILAKKLNCLCGCYYRLLGDWLRLYVWRW